jgi:hypothetical protein
VAAFVFVTQSCGGGTAYSLKLYLKIVNGVNDAPHWVWISVGDGTTNFWGKYADIVVGTIGSSTILDPGDGTSGAASISSAGNGFWQINLQGDVRLYSYLLALLWDWVW